MAKGNDPASGGRVDRPTPGRRRRTLSPPVVAAALSGFVVGVFLTLLAAGLLNRPQTKRAAPVTVAPATMVAATNLERRIASLVSQQLGPMPSLPRRSRLLRVSLAPLAAGDAPLNSVRRYASYRSVTIVFRLNNHPLGPAWRLRAARADVFALMKSLFTSQLPIYDVTLIGRFPLKMRNKGAVKPRRAMVVSLDHETATVIPWKQWSRGDEPRLWSLLTYKWVNPRLAQ